MKHTVSVTALLVLLFFLSQGIGLFVVSQYIEPTSVSSGNVTFSSLPYNIERPQVDEGLSFWYLFFSILLATGLLLLIMKLKRMMFWKAWFLLSVFLTLAVSLASVLRQEIAALLALALAILKLYKPNVFIHNATEILMYGGLAAIFVPMMNLFSAVMLLLLISGYDMYAVWKSKHMVKIAEFSARSKVFPGLSIAYGKKQKEAKTGKTKTQSVSSSLRSSGEKSAMEGHAVLGGGDMGFPLLFSGVVFKTLLPLGMALAFGKALLISACATVALYLLLIKGKKGRFYPAMPFISAGCFFGYALTLLF